MAPAAVGSSSGNATAALMFGVNFVVNLTVSIVAPILPRYLAQRQLLPVGSLGASVQGMLFSSASLATLVVTPCAPALMRKLGKHAACVGGLLLFSLGILVFGLADRIVAGVLREPIVPVAPHPEAELAILFAARIITATGGSVAMLGSMSIAMDANPANRGTLMGASETAIGVGFSVGPSIGAAFFTAGGFPAPFMATSIMSLGLLPLLVLSRRRPRSVALQETELAVQGPQEPVSGTQAGSGTPPSPWTSPAALSVAMVAMVSLFCLGFLDPTLAPFEAEILGASTAGAGVLFSCCSFPYALLGTVVGAIVDAAPGSAPAMVCSGGISLGVSLLLVPPLAPFMATWAWQVIALFCLGLTTAFAMVPVVPLMINLLNEKARTTGRPSVDEDQVLSFTWMAFTLGELGGPLVGSYLAEVCGFARSAYLVGSFILVTVAITCVLLGCSGQCSCCGRREAALLDQPLLGEPDDDITPRRHGTDMPSALAIARAVSGSFSRVRTASRELA